MMTVRMSRQPCWWSTYSMVERLLVLKDVLTLLKQDQVHGSKFVNLNPSQWNLLSDIAKFLKPFMAAQKVLEGEKYVTISLLCSIIHRIRASLTEAQIQPDNSEYVTKMLNTLRTSFDQEWGSGVTDTAFEEHYTLGPRNRHKGFRPVHMVAHFIDPRMKNSSIFGDEDKKKIVKEVLERGKCIATELYQEAIRLAPTPVDAAVPVAAAPRGFEDLLGLQRPDPPPAIAVAPQAAPDFEAQVQTELAIYGNEGALDIYSNPLEWWKERQGKMPVLSLLARRILCIPATSAPSERLFSVAGLTIANDRARLLPDNAADLIFLRGAWGPLLENIDAR